MGGSIPHDFTKALLVFLPKGSEEGDRINVIRSAETVRPLCLGNTDAKIVIAVIVRPLVEKSAETIDNCQRGFIPALTFKKLKLWFFENANGTEISVLKIGFWN